MGKLGLMTSIWIDSVQGFCLSLVVDGVALQERWDGEEDRWDGIKVGLVWVSSKCQPNRPATVPEAKWEHFINTNSKGEVSKRWVYEHQRGRGQLPAWSSSEVAADIPTFLINLNSNRRKKKKNAITEFLMNDFVTKEYLSECNKKYRGRCRPPSVPFLPHTSHHT